MARVPAEIHVAARLVIPGREVRLKAVRSGGPGGQHVNRTASKVELRWSLAESSAPSDADRSWLAQRLASRLTSDGELVLTADTERDQHRNVDEVLDRFIAVLREALRRPRKRKATRPTRASKERRLDSKKRQSARKRDRRTPSE
ncbi:MAG: alternative ribosome rescue aminoacyl-tRNA hydrolase ArfB [Planctomycetota bacterium]